MVFSQGLFLQRYEKLLKQPNNKEIPRSLRSLGMTVVRNGGKRKKRGEALPLLFFFSLSLPDNIVIPNAVRDLLAINHQSHQVQSFP